jgi:hypothetical protein
MQLFYNCNYFTIIVGLGFGLQLLRGCIITGVAIIAGCKIAGLQLLRVVKLGGCNRVAGLYMLHNK